MISQKIIPYMLSFPSTVLLCLFLLFPGFTNNAQEIPEFEKTTFIDSAGNIFVNEKMPVYLFLTPEAEPEKKHIIHSPSDNANPLYFDGHGEHFLTHHDPVSGKKVNYKIFADGLPPKSSMKITKGLVIQFQERFYCDEQITVEINAEDEFSGIKKTFYRFDEGEFNVYHEPFQVKAGETRQIFYFSVDNVGNVEKPVLANLIFDIEHVIDLENIYFSHDSDALNEDAQEQLDELAKALKEFPEIRIELRSHTDIRGSSAYNQRLSERRAKSTKNYLVARGISADRLIARGYGDNKIINHCVEGVECTDEEHRKNRRTEFRIIPFDEEQ